MGLDQYAVLVDESELEGFDTVGIPTRLTEEHREKVAEDLAPFESISREAAEQRWYEMLKPEKEIAYWRKQYTLHEWMTALFKEKGGECEFAHWLNGEYIRLSPEDLTRLELDIIAGKLNYHAPSIKDNREFEFEAKEVRRFIAVARYFMKIKGKAVLYSGDF